MSRFNVMLQLILLVIYLHYPASVLSGESIPTTPLSPSINNIRNPFNSTEIINKKIQQTGHIKEISLFVLSYDGRLAITADEDENNFIWDLSTGTFVREIGKPEAIRLRVVSAAFSPESTQLLWARTGKIMPVLWDIESGRRLGVLSSKEKGHSANIVAITFSSDGRYIATGDNQGTIVIWNRADRSVVRRIKAHSGEVRNLIFIPTSNELVSGGADGAVQLWGVSGTELLETLLEPSEHPITSLVGSANGQLLYAALDDMTVKSWTVPLRKLRSTLDFTNRQINSIALSPDGDYMAVAQEDDSIMLWSIRESRVAWKIDLENSITQVVFSPNGKRLYTTGGDNWIREWDVISGQLLKKFGGVGG